MATRVGQPGCAIPTAHPATNQDLLGTGFDAEKKKKQKVRPAYLPSHLELFDQRHADHRSQGGPIDSNPRSHQGFHLQPPTLTTGTVA
ncbi:hypothetical protein NDU88_007537 [Pleurodeles waltl]|uniref:Uncharacterized protein n=1 Tax=Pleurodeles waltl TaxID=8319 RepID=A0AAV7QP43_PLEWA|nr:hypothetical protein NDU88_007537 [Pleurodeles waltl]